MTAALPVPDKPVAARSPAVAYATIAGMSLLYGWSFFQRVAVPGPLFGAIQADMHLSAAAITGLASALLYIYAPGQLVTGYLADRYGSGRLIVAGGILLSIGAIGFPLSYGVPALYGFRMLVGVGAAVMYICTLRELATLFDARGFARLLGPVMFMGGVGGMLGTAPLAWAAELLGWRGALLAAGVLTALSTVVLAVLLRRIHVPSRPREAPSWAVMRQAAGNRRLRPLMVIAPVTFVTYFLFAAVIGPKYLQDIAGCSATGAARLTFLMQATSIALLLLSGPLDALFRQRRRPAVLMMTCLVLAGVLLLGAATLLRGPLSLHVIGLLALAAANGLMPLHSCACKEHTHPAAVAFTLALMNGLVYLGVAFSSQMAGVVLDWFAPSKLGDGAVRYPPAAYAALLALLLPFGLWSLLAATRVAEPPRHVDAARTEVAEGA